MDRTTSTESSPSLISLGGDDAGVCVDGFCEVPAPQTETVPEPTSEGAPA